MVGVLTGVAVAVVSGTDGWSILLLQDIISTANSRGRIIRMSVNKANLLLLELPPFGGYGEGIIDTAAFRERLVELTAAAPVAAEPVAANPTP